MGTCGCRSAGCGLTDARLWRIEPLGDVRPKVRVRRPAQHEPQVAAGEYEVGRLAAAQVLAEGETILDWHELVVLGANIEHGTADPRERDGPPADREPARCKLAAAVGVAHDVEKQLPCERHVAVEPVSKPVPRQRPRIRRPLRELGFGELGGKEAGYAAWVRDAPLSPARIHQAGTLP